MRRHVDSEVVSSLDKMPRMQPEVGKLHVLRYKNFVTESGAFVGEKKTLIHFAQVRCEPSKFMELLKKFLFSTIHRPKITEDTGVVLCGLRELGIQDAFTVLWEEPLERDFLSWVSRQVRKIDESLSQ